jgi:hypothetical protein
MSRDRVRLRTPWLDLQPHEAISPTTFGAGQGRRGAPPGGRRPPGSSRRRGADRPGRPSRTGTPTWVSAVAFVAAIAYLGAIVFAAGGNKEAFGAVVTGPILLLIGWIIARKLAAKDDNPEIVPVLMGAVCLKLLGSAVRWWVAATVYGTGDFYDYDKVGRAVANGLRHGHLITLRGRLAGSNFIRLVTGFIYFATPSRMMSGFLIYGFLSLIGLIFFWRAYRVAVSKSYDLTYLKWIVLLPSLIYWPSAIGKDAFMVLAAGIAAYGSACLLSERVWAGILGLSVGMAGMLMVRPHFALATCGGLLLAFLVRRNRGGFMQSLVGVAFVAGLSFLVLKSASSFFNISAFNQSSIVKALSETSQQTGQGGSNFHAVVVHSPLQLPLAAMTVLYRPFVFEAHSAQEMLTAIEGSVLFLLTLRAWRPIRKALRDMRQVPYFAYCLGALLLFIVAFSGFSNFGILARERAVIQPLFLVFLSLPRNFSDLGSLAPGAPPRKPKRYRYAPP